MGEGMVERVLGRPSKVKRRMGKRFWQTTGFIAFLFLLPDVSGFLVFKLWPVMASLLLSMTQWDLLTRAKFVGLQNYVKLLTDDPLFWISLKNTTYYAALEIPAIIVVSLVLALAMNQRIRGINLFRILYFIPVVSNMAAVALVWAWMYNYDFGVFNFILSKLHLPRVHWLGSEIVVIPSIVLMTVWKGMGYYMVIFLAGLQGIPQHLYEAAEIDGANSWQKFWKITLPLLSPTLFFVGVMSAIGAFQVFGQVYMMTSGGPGNSSRVYNYYLYENAFLFFKMGYACAMAYILFGIVFTVTLLQTRVFGRRVEYSLV